MGLGTGHLCLLRMRRSYAQGPQGGEGRSSAVITH
ncbi:hypothetical protein F8280_11285 [Micromonospora noduli]|nr:hypothetical protein F8280_11285 [Micromonospora noduli]